MATTGPSSAPERRADRLAWGSALVGVMWMAGLAPMLSTQLSEGQWPAARAADAKPLFVAARAVELGADPLDAEVLATVARQSGMREGGGAGAVRHADPRRGADKGAAYASMYPASAAVLLQVFPTERWDAFLSAWRTVGAWLLLAGAAAAGAVGAGRRTAVLGAGLGLSTVLLCTPSVSEALGVAQANVHIAGITGLAIAAAGLSLGSLVGVLAVLGAGLKLLPGALLVPLGVARQWRGLAAAAVTGLVLTALVAASVPLNDALVDVLESVRYQSAVAPKWVLRGAPRPAFVLYHLRQVPLLVASAAVIGALAWGKRGTKSVATAGPPLAAAVAVAAASLGVLGGGSQRIYAVLLVPVWAWVVGRAVSTTGPWLARGVALGAALLVVAPRWLDSGVLVGWDGRATVLAGAWVAWAAAVVSALALAWPGWTLRRRGGVLAALCWLVGLGAWWWIR